MDRSFLLFFQDCFRDAARELAESPEVGIIQHESGMSHPYQCI